jgi:hypothetical protein
MVTGKEGTKLLRYTNVRFYKTDMSGNAIRCISSSRTALTKLIGNPVLWNGESQITGDLMHLIGSHSGTRFAKVLNNTFLVSKDTLGTGYNQVKDKISTEV